MEIGVTYRHTPSAPPLQYGRRGLLDELASRQSCAGEITPSDVRRIRQNRSDERAAQQVLLRGLARRQNRCGGVTNQTNYVQLIASGGNLVTWPDGGMS